MQHHSLKFHGLDYPKYFHRYWVRKVCASVKGWGPSEQKCCWVGRLGIFWFILQIGQGINISMHSQMVMPDAFHPYIYDS